MFNSFLTFGYEKATHAHAQMAQTFLLNTFKRNIISIDVYWVI